MEKTAQIIQDAIKQLFGIDQIVQLTQPDPNFGDFATNIAMQLVKKVGTNPREIANQLTQKLNETGKFQEVSVAGPGFINIRLSSRELANTLNEEWSDNYGENNDGAGKTVIVEYPSQNMAKPYSIGHLRTGNQGWAAKRLMEVSGWKDCLRGKWGSQCGMQRGQSFTRRRVNLRMR